MSAEPQLKLRTNHHTIRVAPAGADPDFPSVSEAIVPELLHAVELSFRSHLLACSPDGRFEMGVAGVRPLQFVTKRTGDTALVAGMLRDGISAVECLTICCTGLDGADDGAALDTAVKLIARSVGRSDLRDVVQSLIEQVRPHAKPLAVHMHFRVASYHDPAIRIVTHCLAESFFDLFGIEKSLQAAHV